MSKVLAILLLVGAIGTFIMTQGTNINQKGGNKRVTKKRIIKKRITKKR